LTSAALILDRWSDSNDPDVRKVVPMTIGQKGDADICVKADYNQLYRFLPAAALMSNAERSV